MAAPKQNILGSLDGRVRSNVRFKQVPSFENILENTGNFGPWQIVVYVLFLLIDCSIGLVIFSTLTAEEVPGWRCSPDSDDVIENGTNVDEWNRCPVEGGCTNVTYDRKTSVVAEWNLLCDQGYIIDRIKIFFIVGIICGALCGGVVSDVFGRRRATLIFWPMMLGGQALSGLSVSWIMYLLVRTLTAFFTGCCLVAPVALAMENLGTKSRIFVPHRLGISLAAFMTSLMGFLLDNWRYGAYASGLLSVPAFPLLVLFLSESPRWLLQRSRIPEAEVIVTKIGKLNRKPLRSLAILTHLSELDERERRNHGAYTFLDLFSDREYAGRTMTLLIVWCLSFTSLCTLGIIVLELNIDLLMKIIGVGGVTLISKTTNIYLANRFGRKKSFISNIVLSIITSIAVVVFDCLDVTDLHHGDVIRSALALAGFTGLSSGVMTLECLTVEVYPTVLRCTALGSSIACGATGCIIALFMIKLETTHPAIPTAIQSLLLIISAILVGAILPETRGRDLSEELPPKRIFKCCACTKLFPKKSRSKLPEADRALVQIAKETNRDYKRDYFQMDFSKPRSNSTRSNASNKGHNT